MSGNEPNHVVHPSKFSFTLDVDYFLNIFTRKFRQKSEKKKKTSETINNVNVILCCPGKDIFYNVIHALGLLTLLIFFKSFFPSEQFIFTPIVNLQ